MTTLVTLTALLEEQRGKDTDVLEYVTEALNWSRRLGMVEEQALMEELIIRLSS